MFVYKNRTYCGSEHKALETNYAVLVGDPGGKQNETKTQTRTDSAARCKKRHLGLLDSARNEHGLIQQKIIFLKIRTTFNMSF